MIKGIDVSHWQGEINWYTVAGMEYKFAFIKASEGMSFVDSKYDINWQGAKEAELYRGAYHFWREAYDYEVQAEHFRKTVGSDIGEIYPVLDLEDTSAPKGGTTPSKVLSCLQSIEARFGKKPIIYSAIWWWNNWMIPWPDWASEYDLWVAHWTDKFSPSLPAGWKYWKFWQYTSMGKVPGIKGNVDLNRFNGDETAFRKYIGMDDIIVHETDVPKDVDKIIINLL